MAIPKSGAPSGTQIFVLDLHTSRLGPLTRKSYDADAIFSTDTTVTDAAVLTFARKEQVPARDIPTEYSMYARYFENDEEAKKANLYLKLCREDGGVQ